MNTLAWWLDREENEATFDRKKGTVTFPVNHEDFATEQELSERLRNLTLMYVNVRYQILGKGEVPHPEKIPTADHTRLIES